MNWYYQYLLAQIYKECSSIFGRYENMTDKQIIGGRGSAKPYTTLNTIEVMLENKKLKSELKAKEQECEMWKNLTVDNGAVALKYQQQLDQLKAENEELKNFHINLVGVKECEIRELVKLKAQLLDQEAETLKAGGIIHTLKQALTEIKSTLEFYANSKIGEEQPDKTYKLMLNGNYIMAYDPNPARQALQKISDVLDEDDSCPEEHWLFNKKE